MSVARRNKRKTERDNAKHRAYFTSLLEQFYKFMSRPDQPSDDDVRANFISLNNKWKRHCEQYNLTKQSYSLFSIEIKAVWEHKKLALESSTLTRKA